MSVAVSRQWHLHGKLLLAIRNNDVQSASMLFNQGVDTDTRFIINSLQLPAICISVENNDIPMVQLMIDLGVSVNQKESNGRTPLHIASMYGYIDMIRLLLDHRADPNTKDTEGSTPLQLACHKADLELVQCLLAFGANVGELDKLRRTALHIAALQGNASVVSTLLQNGADNHCSDLAKQTSLHFATSAIKPNVEVVQCLARTNPCSILAVDKYGNTPLHLIASKSTTEAVQCVEYMLKTASICIGKATQLLSPRTPKGHTPLHLAVLDGNYDIVRVLVAAGAETSTRDQLGRTPLDCAIRDRNKSITALLVAAGATTSVILRATRCGEDRALVQPKNNPSPLTSFCRRSLTRHYGPSLTHLFKYVPYTLQNYLTFKEL